MAVKRNKLVPSAPPRRVVVALRMAGIAGQDKLNGIFDYLSAGRRWQLIIYRTKNEFTAEVVEQELVRGADGFIVGIPGTEDALSRLAASSVPTVVIAGPAHIAEGNERPRFVQNYTETSNVNVVNEMVQMIEVNRAYEANQKTITSEDSMMGTLWQKVAVLQ